jgi:predicted helicase
VLHSSKYRKKYELNLKRELPRIPFYDDFWQWAKWGEELMNLHSNYATIKPYGLKRIEKSIQNKKHNEAILKADRKLGRIIVDSQTVLEGIPDDAWAYRIGNRSALEWVLDQYKEKLPKDPTVRERFYRYQFKDYKERVVDLLLRIVTVSVETTRITKAMEHDGKS